MTSSRRPAASSSDSAARTYEQKECLSIILGVASLVTPELSEAGRVRMDRLRAAAHRIRDLLNAEVEESGDEFEEVEVQRLFDAVCDALRERAEVSRVKLVLDCGGGRLRACEAELREALFNIVSSALAATPAERAIDIRTETTPDGDQVWKIHGSGIGMRRGHLDPFRLPHRSFRHVGSGLGVALARAIVNRHGGTLDFDSIRGRGTTVTIRLPRAERRASTSLEAPLVR